MNDDIIETLLKHHGEIKRLRAKVERLESRGINDMQHEIAEQAAEIERLRAVVQEAALSGTFFGYRKLEQKLQLAKIERLTAALQKIHDIWDGPAYSNLCEGACGVYMFEVAEKALKET